MGIRLWAALVVTLTVGCSAEEQLSVQAGPPIPYEDVGACPCEGCVYREWVALARPAPGPGGLRRPLHFSRAVRPAAEAYKIR